MKRIEIASPSPVLNTPDFRFAFGGATGVDIPRNEKGHPHFFEFVALPGMVFSVVRQCSEFVYQVLHPSYPGPDLYIDIRFGKEGFIEKKRKLPSKAEMIDRMAQLMGKPYVWGGNWSRGILDLLSLYPPKGDLDEKTKTLWTLEGIDCSGLLYEASLGTTPRNTSQLLHFGNALKIKGFGISQIASTLEPLDMIVYPGHVLFVLDRQHTIESKSPYGMMRKNLLERLSEIVQERIAVDEWSEELDSGRYFMIRRIS
jgi:hypothetical protein